MMTNTFEKRIGMQMLEVPIVNFVMAGFMDMFDKDPSARVVNVTADTDVVFAKIPREGKRYELHITVTNKRTGRSELVKYTQAGMGVSEVMVEQNLAAPTRIDYLWLAMYIAKAVGGILGQLTVEGEKVPDQPKGQGYSIIARDDVSPEFDRLRNAQSLSKSVA
ncbi:hypothetical protein [Pseudomonas phage D6]|nr:hypothetical protein [Pseudomonas phage D6]